MESSPPTLWTIGHSTRPLATFGALLHAHRIGVLADVRRVPQSRRHPHFSRQALERALAAEGIGYQHFESLGGLRDPVEGSIHTGLRNPAFRGYADHMASGEFAAALDRLMALAQEGRVAVMCAEADPKHCHRLLLSDEFTVRGWTVEHILEDESGAPRTERHALSRGARDVGGQVAYPGSQTTLGLTSGPDRTGEARS